MFVKICGITRPDDAADAAAAGADAIGLNFVPSSSRCIDVETARSILAVTPDHVMTVGVFRDQPVEHVLAIARELGLRAVQLHGSEPDAEVAQVAAAVSTVIKVIGVAADNEPRVDTHPSATIMMLDAATPGGGEPFDWHLAAAVTHERPILLAGGLRPDNVASAIGQLRPWGVDVASGVETAPGVKDAEAMRAFVAAAHHADRRARPTAGLGDDLVAYYDAEARARLRTEPNAMRVGLRHEFTTLLRAERRHRLLDVGAGPGRDTIAFHRDGFEVVGLDLAPGNVAEMQSLGLQAVTGSIFELPFDDGAFGALWTMSTFVHVPRDRADEAIAELVRVTVPGGPIAIGTWGGRDFEGVPEFGELRPYRFFSLTPHDEWLARLQRHGRVERFTTFAPDASGGWEYQFAVLRRK